MHNTANGRTMNESYAQVIDILVGDYDWKAIVVAIAKEHPEVVCGAVNATADKTNLLELNYFHKNVLDYYRDEGKVRAITHWREVTGDGLKEAKHAVESLVDSRLGQEYLVQL